jgi:hypothetical protein
MKLARCVRAMLNHAPFSISGQGLAHRSRALKGSVRSAQSPLLWLLEAAQAAFVRIAGRFSAMAYRALAQMTSCSTRAERRKS